MYDKEAQKHEIIQIAARLIKLTLKQRFHQTLIGILQHLN